jgi:flagellar basal-body rod protein FlgG
MIRSLWIAKTGLDAQQTRMSVVSNNLANVNTTGFKKSRAVFEDLIYQTVRQAGAQSAQNTELPSGLMLGTGVRTVATQKLHSQGNIVQTNNSFDVAVQGNGFSRSATRTAASSTRATVPSAWMRPASW